jgi:Spy/CpxP family protein refolding chaperone
MRKRQIVIMIVAVMMALAGVETAMARIHGMRAGSICLRALMELDLSDAQKVQIAAVMAGSKADRETARQKDDKARDILAPVLETETFNEENVRAAFRRTSSLMEDITVIRAKVGNQIRTVLTEEQRQILERGKEAMKRHAEFEETLLNTWLQTTSSWRFLNIVRTPCPGSHAKPPGPGAENSTLMRRRNGE